MRPSATLPVAGVERRKGGAAAGDRLDDGRIGSGGGCRGSTDLFVVVIGRESRAALPITVAATRANVPSPHLILLTSCRIAPGRERAVPAPRPQ